ncbi:MAG TPA: AraC family transcriptional regulator [Ktedonobacteraceae bacterium]|jgi:AraC-like DNA-binding protein|nr:AraC family transcriptional regulator [Ktedonobacteraceae bacterium]
MHKTPEHLHKTPKSHLCLEEAGTWVAPRGKNFLPHQHSTWELIYYRTGYIRCPLGEEVYESQPGMLLLTPPHTVHAEIALTDYSNFWVQIDAPVDRSWPRMCLDDTDHTFERLFGTIVRERASHTTGSQEMIFYLLGQLDIQLLRAQEQEQLSEAEQLLFKAERIIAERSSVSVLIKDVACELGCSPSFLRAQFMRLRGQSPKEYLQSVRLRRALGMLHHSESSLAIIAELCGYDSASHLSRNIKRATGKSPGSLRLHKMSRDE